MDMLVLVVSNLISGLGGAALGMWLTMIALNLEFVRRKITEEETFVSQTAPLPAGETPRRRRRYGWRDVILTIIIVGFAATGFNQIQSNNRSADASDDATAALKSVQAQNRCLTMYSNELADALDRRTTDNIRLQSADSMRDDAVDGLLAQLLSDPPGTPAEVRSALVELRKTNTSKRIAKEELETGRTAASYPQAPRDVCAS